MKLPEIPPPDISSVGDFFLWRFPRIDEQTWQRRFREGKVFTITGPLGYGDPYQPLLEIFYEREVDVEWPVRRDYRIIYDKHGLMAVDKPPFLPITPAGHYLENCLLNFLIIETSNGDLTPLHRLDKDTSGVTLFSTSKQTRSHFHGLFRPEGRRFICEVYEALCERTDERPFPAGMMADHIARHEEFYHLQSVYPDREPNSFCDGEILEEERRRILVRMKPRTGRKHQIRLQLSSRNFPIVNDPLYGVDPRREPFDLNRPLHLNCRSIRITGFPLPADEGVIDMEWKSAFA